MCEKRRSRALCLLSGGLDSMLAIKVLQEQGIDVTAVTFTSLFFSSKNAEKAIEQLRVPLKIVDFSDEHLKLVKKPPHGYGNCMNPCIDCHAMMLERACGIMEAHGFDLIATGEVLGERPMSQNRQALDNVARYAGLPGRILRPLSARLLPPTEPEMAGIVDRERLLSISGRSRKPQFALAEKFGIRSFLQPAGGCLLTDPSFGRRLKELFDKDPHAGPREVRLLKHGRHFRFASGAKAIVGRNRCDNESIFKLAAQGDVLIESDITPGPVTLLVGDYSEPDVETTASLCASFADNRGGTVDLRVSDGKGSRRMRAVPRARDEFLQMRIN